MRQTNQQDGGNWLSMTRRSLLRRLGIGGAAVVAGGLGHIERSSASPICYEQPTGILLADQVKPKPTGVPSISCKSGSKKIVWMVRNDPVENDWEANVARPAFMQQNPDLCLEIVSVKSEDVAVKRPAMIAAGDKLHVWSSAWGGAGPASDLAQGFLQDLTPWIERDHFDTSIFQPESLKFYNVGGRQYGLPINSLGTYVFYNKKLFDEAKIPYPPTDWDDPTWTWDAFIDLAKQLTKNYDNPDKAQYGAVANMVNGDAGVPPLMWGHDIWPEGAYDSGFADGVTFTDERSISSFQAFHDVIHKHKVAPNQAVVQALQQLGGTFPSGRVAMEIQGGWYFWTLKDLINDPNGFCWGAAPLPHGAPDAKIRAQTFTDPWNMTSDMSQDDQELAWTLIKFLVDPANAKKYMETTGTPPAQTQLMSEYFSIYSKCQAPDTVKAVFQGAFTHGIPGSGFKMVGFDQLLQIWANVTDSYFADPGANTKSMAKDLEDQTTAKLKQIKARYKK